MTRTLRLAGFVTAALAAAVTARAQTPAAQEHPGFLAVSAGGQFQSRSFGDSTNFVVYHELATIFTSQQVGGGAIFDATGGYRVWRNLSIGAGLWTFHTSKDAAVTAVVPDPLVFGRPTTVSLTVPGAAQTTVGVNFQVMYTWPVASNVDVSLFAGPTVVHVKQDVATASVVSGTQTVTGALAEETATTGKAGNAGVDLTYRFTDRVGIGAFVRYAGGEADLPSAPKLKVGGLQAGGGVRVLF